MSEVNSLYDGDAAAAADGASPVDDVLQHAETAEWDNRATGVGSSGRASSLSIDPIPEELIRSIRGIEMDEDLNRNGDNHDIEAAEVVPEDDKSQQRNEQNHKRSSRSRSSRRRKDTNEVISTWANALGYPDNNVNHAGQTSGGSRPGTSFRISMYCISNYC